MGTLRQLLSYQIPGEVATISVLLPRIVAFFVVFLTLPPRETGWVEIPTKMLKKYSVGAGPVAILAKG